MNIAGFLKSQFLCHLFISYVFIGTGLIINCIQLFTLPLWPFNKQLYRKINCRLAYCISSRKFLFLFVVMVKYMYFYFERVTYQMPNMDASYLGVGRCKQTIFKSVQVHWTKWKFGMILNVCKKMSDSKRVTAFTSWMVCSTSREPKWLMENHGLLISAHVTFFSCDYLQQLGFLHQHQTQFVEINHRGYLCMTTA